MEQEIKAEFNRSGFTLEDEEEILKKCLTFCINYNLKASDIVSSWELYYLNRQLGESVVPNGEMEGFLLHLQNEQKEAVLKEEPNLLFYSSKDVDMILNYQEDDSKEGTPGTPPDKPLLTLKSNEDGYTSGKPTKLVTPFGRRTNKFFVKFSINDLPDVDNDNDEGVRENSEDDIIKRVRPSNRCTLTFHVSGPEPGCRFMYDRIEDRFDALDNRIRNHAAALVACGLHEEPTDPTVASQRNVFSVGMICCDGEGRLNEKSVMLQSSVEHSGGQQVRLDLHQLSRFSIFPGQIVGVEGHNPSGHCFIASKLVDSIPLSAPADVNLHPAKKQAFDQEIQSTYLSNMHDEISVDQEINELKSFIRNWVNKIAVTVMGKLIASGPFTTTDNLLFEPLTELLAYGKRKLPQLLILLGPFIDSEHPEIKKGTIDKTYGEMFRLEILQRLQDYVEYMGSDAQVVLVPSIRDASHDFVFPQPAFDIDLPKLKRQILSHTNPGIFEVNQVKIGCSTVDIVKQLSGEELSRNPADGTANDRISRLASHILNQRSLYPLYPPAEDVPLDFSLAPEALHIAQIPNILILPSDMKHYIKELSLGGRTDEEERMKCICVNPGRLSKGEGGGTFAELKYHRSFNKMNASIIGI